MAPKPWAAPADTTTYVIFRHNSKLEIFFLYQNRCIKIWPISIAANTPPQIRDALLETDALNAFLKTSPFDTDTVEFNTDIAVSVNSLTTVLPS